MHVSSNCVSYMLYVSACDFQKLFWKQLVLSEIQYFLLRVVRTAMVSNVKQSILMCLKVFQVGRLLQNKCVAYLLFCMV